MAAFLAREDFDLIHDHTSLGPAFAGLISDGPPVVHTLHGPWTPGLKHKLGLVHDRVHLVAISHAQQRLNPAVRIAGVVHNGIDIDAHPFREAEGGLPPLSRAHQPRQGARGRGRGRAEGRPAAHDGHQAVRARGVGVLARRGRAARRRLHHRDRAAAARSQGRSPRPRPRARVPDQLARALRARVRGGARVRHTGDHAPVRRRARDRDERRRLPVRRGLRHGRRRRCDVRTISPHACRARAVEHFSGDAMVRGYTQVYAVGARARRSRLVRSSA